MTNAFQRAYWFYQNDRPRDASKALLQAFVETPEWHEPHVLMTFVQLNMGRPDVAMSAAAEALRLSSNADTAHHAMAVAALANGHEGMAMRSIDEAITCNPEEAMYHVLRARLIANNGDSAGALKVIDQALALDPHNLDAQSMRAMILLNTGRVDEAAQVSRDILAHDPNHTNAHRWRGHALLDRGKVEQARQAFAEALRSAPNSNPTRLEYVEANRSMWRHHRWFKRLGGMLDNVNELHVIVFTVAVAAISISIKHFGWMSKDLFWLLGALIASFALFLVSPTLLDAAGNLVLRFDKSAKLALSRQEERSGEWFAAGLVATALTAVGSLVDAAERSELWSLLVVYSMIWTLVVVEIAKTTRPVLSWLAILTGVASWVPLLIGMTLPKGTGYYAVLVAGLLLFACVIFAKVGEE